MINIEKLDDIDLLTACIRGEAEAEPFIGKLAVACVIRNRVNDRRWPSTYRGVILQAKQFSCFLPQYLRPEILKKDWDNPAYRECRFAAWGVYHKWVRDVTGGANHYHAIKDHAIKIHPGWADEMERAEVIAGGHIFYKA